MGVGVGVWVWVWVCVCVCVFLSVSLSGFVKPDGDMDIGSDASHCSVKM